MHALIEFLSKKMKMTDLYQPAVIRELLLNEGQRTKEKLAASLARYDVSVKEYYERILMRYPKETLIKHGVVEYRKDNRTFVLHDFPNDEVIRDEAVRMCDQKIAEWIERKRNKGDPEAGASIRYVLLKESGKKCQLCGIHSSISPMDIDHIIPRSKADKFGRVKSKGQWIHVNDRENLQVLCFKCNRAKGANDDTDFRRTKKLVRDGIPAIIQAEGRLAIVSELHGHKLVDALRDKLVEEHAEFIAADGDEHKLDELADMIEVIFALSRQAGATEAQILEQVRQKRDKRGSFSRGLLLESVSR